MSPVKDHLVITRHREGSKNNGKTDEAMGTPPESGQDWTFGVTEVWGSKTKMMMADTCEIIGGVPTTRVKGHIQSIDRPKRLLFFSYFLDVHLLFVLCPPRSRSERAAAVFVLGGWRGLRLADGRFQTGLSH